MKKIITSNPRAFKIAPFGKIALLFLAYLLTTSTLISQVTYTFTTAGATGATGPTQAQINTAYNLTNLSGSVTSAGGIQTFIVPASGLYRIDITAASGGTPTSYTTKYGGLGARMAGDFNLSVGDVMKILVGQKGTPSGGAGGGGGGTFIVNNNVILIAAGGGGGGTSDNLGAHSTTLTSGTNDFPGGTTPGGVGGNGGQACNVPGANHGGGGAGYSGDGATSTAPTPGGGGIAFVNGGTGGSGVGPGGFGGGGGCTSITVGGGGGGGYSGGAGGQQVNYCTAGINRSGGGGGGSYNAGTNQNNVAAVNFGDGIVIITKLCDVSISAGTNPICLGSSVTLSTNAVSTLSWSAGSSTSSSIVVSPSVSTTYYVTGTGTNNCVSTVGINVTVTPLPNISAMVNPPLLCAGSSATLTGAGASTFTWSGGPSGTTTIVSPSVTTVYNFSGTNGFGCVNTGTVSVSVNSNSIAISGNTVICAGSAANLSASGAVTFTWSTGSFFPSQQFTPAVTTVYSVIGTDVNNCTLTNSVSVNVNPAPNVVASSDKDIICKGETVVLSATGASTYAWINPITGPAMGASVPVVLHIDVPHTYTVTGTSANGCTKSAIITITVDKCSGIAQTLSDTHVATLYPNPSNGIFAVDVPVPANKLEITDITGRVILSRYNVEGKVIFNLGEFANGAYYVKISGLNYTEVLKAIKTNN